jgi:hypothetical protein
MFGRTRSYLFSSAEQLASVSGKPNPFSDSYSLIDNFSNQKQPVKTEWRWIFSVYLFIVVCFLIELKSIQIYG